MKKMLYPFLFLFTIFVQKLSAQEWHKIYFSDNSNSTSAVFESYDKGYVLCGGFYLNSIPTRGLISKIDINGELLWYKVVGGNNNFTSISDINQTMDGGFILTGMTGEHTEFCNPFVLKLNKCAEVDWCKIYNMPNPNQEWGQSIWVIPGGAIALIWAYGDDPSNERIWLYRLDNTGDLLWKQVYAQSDTLIYDEISVRMHVTPDYHFIINGFCWYPDPGTTSPQIIRPFIVQTDSTGVLEWELPWSVVNGENFYGMSYSSITDNQGAIYSGSRHIVLSGTNSGDKPCMIKTDVNGNEVSYTDFFSESEIGTTNSINWMVDSTMVLGYGWSDTNSYEGTIGVLKCDRSGNIIQNKPMFTSSNLFSDAQTTFDNKLLLVGGFWNGIWRSHAYKLNSNLDYDSVYSQLRVYDSLCPHPIPSDTIPLDCVIVGMDDQPGEKENSSLKVYPNPVKDIIHIILPQQIVQQAKTQLFNVTTIRYYWGQAKIEIYDLNGKLMVKQDVLKGQQQIDFDVMAWQKGMYVVRLVYEGQTAGNTKIIIEP